MTTDSDSALFAAFATCAEQITCYYRVLGEPKRICHHDNGLWFLENPGLVIDFVPEIARQGIERMARKAGISVRKGDGGQGKQAYYTFLSDGLTIQKLNRLTALVCAETLRLEHAARH